MEEHNDPSVLKERLDWAVQTGNTEAAILIGGELCIEYSRKLQSFIRSRAYEHLPNTLDREEAIKDTMQETIKRALEAIQNGRYITDGKSFLAWLKGIAWRTLNELLRQRDLVNRIAEKEPDDEEDSHPSLLELLTAEPDDLVERSVLNNELADQLNAALDQLSSKSKMVVLLRQDGYTNKEIARHMGQTEEAIESRYIRAIKKLQKLLLEQAPAGAEVR